jgi:hypothetical protein
MTMLLVSVFYVTRFDNILTGHSVLVLYQFNWAQFLFIRTSYRYLDLY